MTAQFNDRVTEIFRAGKYRSPRSPFASLAQPAQGIGGWAGDVNAQAAIDDTGLRSAAARDGRFTLPDGVPFATPGPGLSPNIAFISQWDNYPHGISVPLTGRARRVFLLMAGSTNWKTGRVRVLAPASFKGRGGVVPGGAATVLDLALDPQKELRSLTVRALANEVVIGLMAATLQR